MSSDQLARVNNLPYRRICTAKYAMWHIFCRAYTYGSMLRSCHSSEVSMGQARQIDSKNFSTVSTMSYEIRVPVSTPAMPFQTIIHDEKLIPTLS
jgi:hypothetical protein